MFSMYDPIVVANGSGLDLITTGESEDDDDNALMKTILALKNQIDEVPKVNHQYQILKFIYDHFLSYISIRIS